MSFEAVLWATNDAPIRDVNEFAVMVMLAEKADPDGCNAFPSRPTMADRTHIDPKTVLRTLQRLEQRCLIGKGNQAAASYIRADRRPVVYDVLIPYSWFPNIERINKERQERGRAPLTPSDRPDIVDAPPKARRSDLGKKRAPKKAPARDDSESPRGEGVEDGHGVTVSPTRGDSESGTGGLRDTQPSPCTQSSNPDRVAPSARSALDVRSTGAGSSAEPSGGSAASDKKRPARLTKQQNAAVDAVFALLPEALRTNVPRHARGLPQAIVEALGAGEPWERTPEQLVEYRVMVRWDRHWASEFYAGRLPEHPVGPLREMLKRNPLCNDYRCDEHVEVDTGQTCRSCAGKRQNTRGNRVSAQVAEEFGAAGADYYPEMPEADTGTPPEWAFPEQRDDEPRQPVAAVPAIGAGAQPNDEYRRQRQAAQASRSSRQLPF